METNVSKVTMDIRRELFSMADEQYAGFSAGLTPTLPREKIIGVRIPKMRELAKKVYGQGGFEPFLGELPHKYYEEDTLHGLIIERMSCFEECLARTEAFLPYIDNWATCDVVSPKVFGKEFERLVPHIESWLDSGKTYVVRFGAGMLMRWGLDEHFSPRFPAMVEEKCKGDYYRDMMAAWYFATALAKRYDDVIPYLTECRLEPWIHNKTIQKAVESRRIAAETKEYLKTLRVRASS